MKMAREKIALGAGVACVGIAVLAIFILSWSAAPTSGTSDRPAAVSRLQPRRRVC